MVAGRETPESRQRAIDDADASYRRFGIQPPTWEPGQIPVTLPMMLKYGWRIEQDADGVKVLGIIYMIPY